MILYFNSHIKIRCVCRPLCDIVPFDRNNSESTLVRRVVCNQNNGRTKSPGGIAPGREIPLIGVADVSLRGLGSISTKKEGKSPSFFVLRTGIEPVRTFLSTGF